MSLPERSPAHAILLVCCLVWFTRPAVAIPQAPPPSEQLAELPISDIAERELDALAFRMGNRILQANRGSGPPAVLIFDFQPDTPQQSSVLGVLLADKLAETMRRGGPKLLVIDRETVKTYFKNILTDTSDLRGADEFSAFAEDVGASELIRGSISEDEGHMLTLTVRTGAGIPMSDSARFGVTRELEDLLTRRAPSNHRDPKTFHNEPGVIVISRDGQTEGVEPPRCGTCPSPRFQAAAHSTHLNSGTIILSAVITADGKVGSVDVVKGLPLELIDTAINVVKGWKLDPARKDGQPVSVRVPVELTFNVSGSRR